MELLISPSGQVKTLYGEDIDLAELGTVYIARASFVEPEPCGGWLVDLGPVNGPLLGPFHLRSQGLEAERQWLIVHRLS